MRKCRKSWKVGLGECIIRPGIYICANLTYRLSKRKGTYSIDLGNSSTARQPKFPVGSRSPSSRMLESRNKEGVLSPTLP